MVAQAVEDVSIDRLVDALERAVGQVRSARSDVQRTAREAVAIRAGDALHAAWVELEETICEQRDWLDAHRTDRRWPARRAEFIGETLRQHALAGEALDRAAGALSWRS